METVDREALSVVVLHYLEPLEKVLPTLLSLQTQNCDKSAVEVVIVNDGGTLLPKDIVQNLLTGYNVRFIDKSINEGMSCARQTGIENSRGRYIFFLDSDDLFYDENGLRAFQEAERTNPELDIYRFREFKFDGTVVWPDFLHSKFIRKAIIPRLTDLGNCFEDLVITLALRHYPGLKEKDFDSIVYHYTGEHWVLSQENRERMAKGVLRYLEIYPDNERYQKECIQTVLQALAEDMRTDFLLSVTKHQAAQAQRLS